MCGRWSLERWRYWFRLPEPEPRSCCARNGSAGTSVVGVQLLEWGHQGTGLRLERGWKVERELGVEREGQF